MSYTQYTSCTSAEDHILFYKYIQTTARAAIPGGISALFVVAYGDPVCWVMVAEITFLAWVIAFCHWWLEDRLICLPTGGGQDRTAVGMVVSIETVAQKSFPDTFDTDLSINLLLLNTHPKVDQAHAQDSQPYGELIKEQENIANLSLPFTGTAATDEGTGIKSAVLHAEFEGAGIVDLLLASQVALGVAVAALIACLTLPPVVAVILWLLSWLIFTVGAIIGPTDTASSEDAGLPSIETNNTDGTGAHILGVMGHWIYDSGHNDWPENGGWNEIHPIKMAQKLGTWDGDWPKGIDATVANWENKVDEAGSPVTIESQKRPENQWQIHPLIDGCAPRPESPGGAPSSIE
jgi:hypothetical protein